MFKRILVANRGEIACAIIRTCRHLGIKTVAVYSEADAEALHVQLADDSHYIGAAPATESYLDIEKIISVAKSSGAEAIHPGYGFLSENPLLAEAAARSGLVFIGAPPHALRALGMKTNARKLLEGTGVASVPWSAVSLDDLDRARRMAADLGLPLMVKASAAGGGMGARIVRDLGQLDAALTAAATLAQRFFGNPEVHIEKYLENARHIEVQVLADRFGNMVHLLERDCSMQRRYQKVIEEAPSTAVSPLLRRRLAHAALQVARAADYVNAGTVEFLVDADGDFYFLEVNCRIQVEHRVTEAITGVPIIEQQLRIAAGERLALEQGHIRAQGHAIEARVYAEDSDTLMPSPGRITAYREPTGERISVDSGVRMGDDVSPYYDPLLAKVIVWGKTRGEAARSLQDALRRYTIEGVDTNIPLLLRIVNHPLFTAGDYHTATLTDQIMGTPDLSGQGAAAT